jgi:hypothetical protein
MEPSCFEKLHRTRHAWCALLEWPLWESVEAGEVQMQMQVQVQVQVARRSPAATGRDKSGTRSGSTHGAKASS